MDLDVSAVERNGSLITANNQESRYEGSVLNDQSKRYSQFLKKTNATLKDLSFRTKISVNQCTHEAFIDLEATVLFVKCSPFERTSEIFAAGTRNGLTVFRITSVPGEDDSTEFAYETLCNHREKGRPTSVAFSPKSDVREGSFLVFAVAYQDCVVICQQDTNEDGQIEQSEICFHNDFINDIVFEPSTGDSLATVSDDCTCCIWSTKTMKQEQQIHLSTPGISVKWHSTEVNKLLVAEKNGQIRIFDVETRTPVQTFECFSYPLLSCDWCPTNDVFIGCATSSELFVWNTSLTSVPTHVMKSSTKMLTNFEFLTDQIIAYRSRHNASLIVRSIEDNEAILDKKLNIGYGLSWNRHHSILIAGGQFGLHIYKFMITQQ